MKKTTDVNSQLDAFIDGELTVEEHENFLKILDKDASLKAELCDAHRLKELMHFAYPLNSSQKKPISFMNKFGAIAASLFLVLGLGFIGGYLSKPYVTDKATAATSNPLDLNDSGIMPLASTLKDTVRDNKVIIYLGHSQKEKFTQALNKAEELLEKYKQDGTEVYVVTSAGGIDLLRNNNTTVQQRIRQMKGLHPSLHFVACNNQIYYLHKKGQPVNLVKEAEVAPSAVQFVVDHIKDGWRYIAI